jgi:hypothetical protein
MNYDALERDAARVLCLLYFCGEEQHQLSLLDDVIHTHSINSEMKLQKFDFWLRYPDHLAAALLRGCEADGPLVHHIDEIKQIIRCIFNDREPIIRWIPMRKYLHGAYEPLDKVLGFLSSRALAGRRPQDGGQRTEYFLTEKGAKAVEAMLSTCPEIQWYVERCQLITRFFGHLQGIDLRNIQYIEPAYGLTPALATIEQIEAEVRIRFTQQFGEPL